MSPPQPSLVDRAALPEQYPAWAFLVFATTPLLFATPWWLLFTIGCIAGPLVAFTARP